MRRNATSTGRVRQAWGTFLVFALALGGTVALYALARRHEQRDLRWVTRLAANSFRADIMLDVGSEITSLRRLAILADRIGSDTQLWTTNAELYLQRRRGCIAVELLTASYQRRSIVYAPEEQRRNTPVVLRGMPVDLLKAAGDSETPMISTSVPVDGRSAQRITIVPTGLQGGATGFVAAFFDVKTTLDSMLTDLKDLGFSMAILEGGQEQYRMLADTKGDDVKTRFTERAEVILPGVAWELRVWPEAPILYAMDARLPELTLIVGALISVLLAATMHFAFHATVKSRNLRQLNEKLIEEMRQRERAEEELRRAQGELETQVQQRTTELSAANVKLEHEIVEHAHANESLQMLTGQLCQIQDEERRRLARELHDGATQNLIAVAMNMASMRKEAVSPAQRAELLDDSVRLIQQSIGELRTTAHLLHPPLIDELGLPVTLRSYVDGFSSRSGIRVAVALDPQLGRLSRDAELGIFRVVQESLANIHRHSHSDTAKVLLCLENAHIRLEISDNGTGIPPEVLSRTETGIAGVGIASMRERVRLLGGCLDVASGNMGTTIRILLPAREAAKPGALPSVSV